MIEVTDLRKSYGELVAVDGISFSIGRGEAFGLLGPNGAGKTTTILMLVGALAPDGGAVSLDGVTDPTRPEVRRRIGVAPQSVALYEELTGAENLAFFGRLYGLSGARLAERVAWGLEFAGLSERGGKRCGTYSGGMQRRLNLACAVVHEPDVLVCDEPTVGVDPQSRNHLLESIDTLRQRGMTLLYTTHYMEEAQRLCERVAIMDHGAILALDTVGALIEQHGGQSAVEVELAADPPPGVELPGELNDSSLCFSSDDPLQAIARLGGAGLEIERLSVQRPDLERVFLQLTGRGLRD